VPAVPVAAATPAVSGVVVVPRGRGAKRVDRVVVSKDGETRVYEGDDARAYLARNPMPQPPIPPVAATLAVPPARPQLPLPPAVASVRVIGDGKGWSSIVPGPGGTIRIRTPETVSRSCVDGPDGGPGSFVLQRELNGKRVMIVCRNRIDQAARDGARRGQELAANARFQADVARLAARDARHDAHRGIQAARTAILADRDLSAGQRRDALAGLDRAQAELRSSRD